VNLIPTENLSIPKLAWTCTLTEGSDDIILEHGENVDLGDGFFFEGAWGGAFETGDFLTTPCFGSGGKLVGQGITLTPPDHILERLCYIRTGPTLLVSNSLAMLIARAKGELDTTRADYHVLLTKMLRGLDHHETELPLKGGRAVTLWAWHHMHIDADLTISKEEKDRPTSFADYTAYETYLSGSMKAIFDNAAHPDRRMQFTPMGTISSGYDSTAITALAADHGSRDAITFSKSRGKLGKQAEDDSGAEASETLGLNVSVMDRLDFRKFDDMPEIYGFGVGSELLSARSKLENRILMTGFLGDTIWDRVPTVTSTKLQLPTIAGHNLGEMRLKTNCIMFPVPFLGCRAHPDIIKISQSKEMEPWALHNAYDRPICRRIAEDRGIPRTAFGIKKKAAGVYFREEGLEATMTPKSYADYSAFRLAHTNVPLWRAALEDKKIEWIRLGNSVLRKSTKLINKATRLGLTPPKIPDTPGIKTQGALLFQWSMTHLLKDYGPPAPK
jgi:hypothetical protein